MGVKRTYYTLRDKIVTKRNMHKAALRVIDNDGSAGVDDVGIKEFEENYEENMREIFREMKEGRYEPSPVLRVFIGKDDGRLRPLGIPTVKDRVAQTTLKRVLEPIFEKVFCDCSYGFRPGRSQIDALNKIEEYREQGYTWVVDADIKGYFDNIDHDLLLEFIKERVTDGWVLDTIESWLTAGVVTDGKFEPTNIGTPQGGSISPLLSNIYLHQFDKEMTERGYKVVRFADDFVVLSKSRRKAERALEVVKEITGRLKLELHPEKTVITNFGEGFIFLGFEFIAWRYKRPKQKRIEGFKKDIRKFTRRQQPVDVKYIIHKVNEKIQGWGDYFGHGNVKTLFKKLDEWIRMRIRSFIEGKKAVYNQNVRIPTSELQKQGLKSLLTTLS